MKIRAAGPPPIEDGQVETGGLDDPYLTRCDSSTRPMQYRIEVATVLSWHIYPRFDREHCVHAVPISPYIKYASSWDSMKPNPDTHRQCQRVGSYVIEGYLFCKTHHDLVQTDIGSFC